MNNEDPLTNNSTPQQPQPNAEPVAQQMQATPEFPEPSQPLQPSIPQAPIATQAPAVFSQPPIEQQPQFSTTLPNQPNNTRSFKPFIFGGVGLLLAALIGITAFTFFVPNQADYNAAIESYNDVADANNKLVADIDSITTGDLPETKTKIEKDYKSYKEAFAELKDLKALRDGETNKVYANLSKKNDAYVKYFDGILATYDDMMKASKDCSSDTTTAIGQVTDINQVVPSYDAAIQPCRDALERLQASDNELIAAYGKDSISFIDNSRAAIKDMVSAVQANNQTAYLAAEGEFTLLTKEFLSLVEQFEKDMKKESDDKSVKNAAHDLKDVLEKKAENSLF